jgi:hypothetical protein
MYYWIEDWAMDGLEYEGKTLEEQVEVLQGIVAKERKKRAKAERELQQLQRKGIDPDEYHRLKEAQANKSRSDANNDAEFRRSLAEQKAQTEAANKRAHDAITKAALTSEFIKAGGDESLLNEFLAVASGDLEIADETVQVPMATHFRTDGTEITSVTDLMSHWRDNSSRSVFFKSQSNSRSQPPSAFNGQGNNQNAVSTADLGKGNNLERLANGEAVLRN